MAVLPSLDISWQASPKRKGKPLGYKNLGNTCYLNSVLQCLTYTPPLANLCLRGLHARQCEANNLACPFCLLESRISRSLNTDIVVEAPYRIHKCLQNFAKHFRPGRQEDAHELLRYAVDACDNVCVQLEKRKLKASSQAEQKPGSGIHTVMREVFGGDLLSQIRCLSCNSVSGKVDNFMDLSLEIMHLKTLKEALSRFFQPELLDGSNKYKCDKCKKLSVARKQMSVRLAPNVLAIQLKRFENVFGGKIDAHVEFDEKLQLRAYMSKASQDTHPDYSLYAVVVHSGFSQYGGHYYAYVKVPTGKWFCCNDSLVSEVDIRTVLAERVYILFYVREFRRPPASLIDDDSGVSSVVSTPSPPTTPESATMAKPLAASSNNNINNNINSCSAARSSKLQEGPKLKFSLVKPGTKLITSVNPRAEQQQQPSSGSDHQHAPAPAPAPALPVAAGDPARRNDEAELKLDPAPSSEACEAGVDDLQAGAWEPEALKRKASVVSDHLHHQQKKQCVSFGDRIAEFRASSEFRELHSSLENEAMEHLKTSGWCDALRECFRVCARESESFDDADFREQMISSNRQKLLKLLPSSMKEHLLQLLGDYYATRVL